MTRRIRPMVFEARTAFPVAAACIVANGVRETLSSLYTCPVELRLYEPVVPSGEAWSAITRDARLYRITGARSDAAIILRSSDCAALASAAFGEMSTSPRPLSVVEDAVLNRIVTALVGNFVSICGARSDTLAAESVRELDGFFTYFEVIVERPVSAAIGIALARQSAPDVQGSVRAEELLDVEIEIRVQTEGTVVPAWELAALEVGAVVPITVSTGLTAVATVAGRLLARGECGVRANRVALAICHSPCTEGGSEPEP